MKTHSEILPQLAAFHDNALSADQREPVASHVRDCPMCQRLLDDWKALDSALKALPEPTAETDGIKAQVLNRIAPRASTVTTVRPERVTRIPIRIWASAAAAGVILVAASLYLRENEQSPQDPGLVKRDIEAPKLASPTAKIDATPEFDQLQAQPSAADQIELPSGMTESVPSVAELQSPPARQEPSIEESGSKSLADQSNSAAASDQSTAGDSGILQSAESSARPVEFVAQDDLEPIEVHYRVPDMLDPAIVDVNLRPTFAAEFEGIGYAPTDMLAEAYDPSESLPRRLPPQVAYLVSSMRMERSVLTSRSSNQVRSPETQLRLAEITWRLANMTADQDDVRNAISAQTAAMRTLPSITTQSLARLAHLRSLQQ